MTAHVIVRNIQEIDFFDSSREQEAHVYLCTNWESYRYCQKRNRDAILLDEESLGADLDGINRWSYEAVFQLINSPYGRSELSRYVDANFFEIRSFLICMLKHLRLIDQVVHAHNIQKLECFGGCRSFLVWTLQRYAEHFNKHLVIRIRKINSISVSGSGFWLRKLLKWILTLGICRLSSLRVFMRQSCSTPLTLYSGSFEHLFGTLSKTKESRPSRIFCCENLFNFQNFKFCQRNRFAYHLLPTLNPRKYTLSDLKNIYVHEECKFKEIDLRPILCDFLDEVHTFDFLNAGFDLRAVESFFENLQIERVVLDEDFASRRTFSVVARERGIPVYIVSHGIPIPRIIDERDRLDRGFYTSGEILVNSQFEKVCYEQMVYDPQKITVIGTPRYDRLFEFRNQFKSLKSVDPNEKKVVLFCGGSLVPYDLEKMTVFTTYAGWYRNGHYEFSRQCLKDVVDIIQNEKKIRLLVKGHYNDDQKWMKLIQEITKGTEDIEYVSHDQDIFLLESKADLILTPPSSVICEALMLNKPVIVWNRIPGAIHAYLKRSVVLHVTNREELSSAISQCLFDEEYLDDLTQKREKCRDYFIGQFDGGNSERVSKYIFAQEHPK